MTALEQEATIRWLNHPPKGTPRLTVGSASLTPSLPLNVDRHATHPLATSPGELLAGVIGAGCSRAFQGIAQGQLEAMAEAAMARCIEALAMRPERIAVTVEALLEGA
jgi:hypothetical protein